jgi:hypothetical protein
MLVGHFRKELGFPALRVPPVFVSAPAGNGCAWRFIRALKENLLCMRTFETIEDTAGAHAPLNIGRDSFSQSLRQRRIQPGIPETAGGTT